MAFYDEHNKERIIQEFVPGKQITLAHIIPNPVPDLYAKMGLLNGKGAIGIFTITPSEGAIIAADVASKAGGVQIGFVDRFNGSLVITGQVGEVEAAMKGVIEVLCDRMAFAKPIVTRS
ncbi:MAG: BMC domain-containing protein [Lachnospiraceae bacterium]|nr:BMC domain-containing protein [Lachnospiraceae bacterium]